MQTTGISNIDIAIVIGYFILVLAIGFWVARSTKTGEDLFLGGRSFGWGLIESNPASGRAVVQPPGAQ